MKRMIATFALMIAAIGCWAMTEDEQDRMVWNHLGDILVEEAGHTAYMYYAKTDVDGDGIDDLIISTESRPTAGRVFKAYSVGKNMAPITVNTSVIEPLDHSELWSMATARWRHHVA